MGFPAEIPNRGGLRLSEQGEKLGAAAVFPHTLQIHMAVVPAQASAGEIAQKHRVTVSIKQINCILLHLELPLKCIFKPGDPGAAVAVPWGA